jgi:hypothetical protein
VRVLTVLALLTALTAGAMAPAEAAHRHKKHKNRADLALTSMVATITGGEVTVTFDVRNKGRRPADANQARIYMSIDATADGIDTLVGQVRVPRLDPKQREEVKATLQVPIAMTPSVYHVISCADAQSKVKERSEYNNCRGTKNYMLTPAVVRVDSTAGGSVSTSSVSGGSCRGTLCGFAPGQGNVTFTPKPNFMYRFSGWSGCTGYNEGPNHAITFTSVGTSQVCHAAFTPIYTLRWGVSYTFGASGYVTATGTDVTCTAPSSSGSCVFNNAGSSVTLTATPGLLSTFNGWANGSAGACDGVINGNQVTITGPIGDKSCIAKFKVL